MLLLSTSTVIETYVKPILSQEWHVDLNTCPMCNTLCLLNIKLCFSASTERLLNQSEQQSWKEYFLCIVLWHNSVLLNRLLMLCWLSAFHATFSLFNHWLFLIQAWNHAWEQGCGLTFFFFLKSTWWNRDHTTQQGTVLSYKPQLIPLITKVVCWNRCSNSRFEPGVYITVKPILKLLAAWSSPLNLSSGIVTAIFFWLFLGD